MQCCSLAHVLLLNIESELINRLFAKSFVKTKVWNWSDDRFDEDLSSTGLGCGAWYSIDLDVSTIKIFQSKRVGIVKIRWHIASTGRAFIDILLIVLIILIKPIINTAATHIVHVLSRKVVNLRHSPVVN